MKLFDNHQRRIWIGMLLTISEYRAETLSYPTMVGSLEGGFDAGGFEDTALREKWYDFWMPLEIARSTNAFGSANLALEKYVSEIETFLKNTLAENDNSC